MVSGGKYGPERNLPDHEFRDLQTIYTDAVSPGTEDAGGTEETSEDCRTAGPYQSAGTGGSE